MSSKFTDQEQQFIEEALSDPSLFCEYLLVNPDTNEPLEPNFPQKKILQLDGLQNWICVHRRAGKALSLNSKIFTPTGFTLNKDIKIGDRILTPEGDVTVVTNLHYFDTTSRYLISFCDGTEIIASGDHLWQVYSDENGYQTLTTNEIRNSKIKYKIDPVSPANHLKKSTPISPYNYGIYLSLEADDKEIEPEYLFNSISDRIELMKGLMDYSGVDYELTHNRFVSRGPVLAKSVAELARGLGCYASVEGDNVLIIPPENLNIFRRNKNKITRFASKDKRRKGITNILAIKDGPAQCITVDNPSHLFITDNYTPTHNCIVGEALVINPISLKPTPISELELIRETLVYDFTLNEVKWSTAKWIKNNELKHSRKLQLESGVALPLSDDHLVFSRKHGWIRSDKLRVGDEILSPAEIPVFGDKDLFTTSDYHEDLSSSEMGFVSIKQEDQLVISYDNLLRKCTIPDPIFQLTKQSLINWFKIIWESMGRALPEYNILKIFCPEYETSILFRHLLLRLGIESRIDPDNNILITDEIDRRLFLNTIGFDVEILDLNGPRNWQTIINIKDIGMQECYDISVNHPDHNFLANDTVVHNSFVLAGLAIYQALIGPARMVHIFAPSSKQRDEIIKNIDNFMNTSAFLRLSKAARGNSNQNPVKRTFKNRSYIELHIVGTREDPAVIDGLRGLTADALFIDEAQELSDHAWKVLTPIMVGDQTRRHRMRSYIFGTIVEPVGQYYENIFVKEQDQKKVKTLLVPVTENEDLTDEDRSQMRNLVTKDNDWQTEYLLIPSTTDTSVFRQEDIEKAFSHDYEYGTHLIKHTWPRIIGVDWDKTQSGTSILICQLNPLDQKLQAIWREEIPRGPFTLTTAVQRILELWVEFNCTGIAIDRGYGDYQHEELQLKSMERGLDLHHMLEAYTYQSKIEVEVPQGDGLEKKYVKDFIVSLSRRAFEDGMIKFPMIDRGNVKDEKGDPIPGVADQFFKYKVVKDRGTRKTFSNTDEHFIDCLGMICLYVFKNITSLLEPAGEEQVIQIFTQKDYDQLVSSRRDEWGMKAANKTKFYNKGLTDF